MDKDKLHVVVFGTGTSQGVPVIGCECTVCRSSDPHDRRLRTAIYVTYKGTAVVVDIGPDFRQQMLSNNLKELDAVLLTHEHDDHVSGLDDIRPINFRLKKDIPIYGLRRVLENLQIRYPYVFEKKHHYAGKPRVELFEVKTEPLQIGSLTIQPIKVLHGDLDILGYRFGNFAYITDAKTIDDKWIHELQGLDVLIINALHRRRHFSHLNLDEALEMIGRIRPKQAYLTHLSHDMGLDADVNNELPDNVSLAYDGLELDVVV